MMKQTSKQILTILAFVLPLLFGCGLGLLQPVYGQSMGSRVVINPLTGIAIDGYDPVSYFTEPEPLEGLGEFEYVWNGVPWHFTTAANRDVFIGSPEIYCPQYGGHGAMGMARGFVSDGSPTIYTVFNKRLYLFYSAANREAFLLSPVDAAVQGAANWPELSKMLTSN